jgi:hypothetical protein
MAISFMTPLTALADNTLLTSGDVCPVHTPVWAPNLDGADAEPSGRNYVTSADGETLGLILSSSRTPPAGFQILDGGVLRHQSGGGGDRTNIVAKGTSTNGSEEAGFDPADGQRYRITLTAQNEFMTGPADIGFRANGAEPVIPAKLVSGSTFEFVWTYDAAAALASGDSGHGAIALGIVTGNTGTIVHYSNIKIYEVGGECIGCECPVHETGESVWKPDLAGADAAPSQRNYVTSADGETLGFILSSSRTPPAGFQVLTGGILRHRSGGGGERTNIVAKGTSSNGSEQAGFPAEDGQTYRITFTAQNEFMTGPADIGFRANGAEPVIPAKPVRGSTFEFVWTYDAAAALASGDSGHGAIALGIVTGNTGTIVHYSNFEIFTTFGDCICEKGVLEWEVFPLGSYVDDVGTPGNSGSGHILKLSNLEFDPDLLPTRGATLDFSYRATFNTGRRLLAWTDLSGPIEDVEDFTFATTDNIVAGKIAVSDALGNVNAATLTIPQELLYDEETDTYATVIYVLFGINKGPTGDMDAGDNYNMIAGNRGGTARNNVNGVDLAREFDVFDLIKLNVLEPIVFNINISLNPGADESQMGFTWWTPKGESKSSVLQLVKAGDLVAGEMPSDAAEFKGVPAPLHSDKEMYDFDVNKVMVTGLEPGAVYAYRVGDGTDKNWSPIYTFRTYDPSNAYNVILYGDPQLGRDTTRLGNLWRNTMTRAVARTDAMGGASFILSAGDQTGAGANCVPAMESYLSPAELRSIPVMATVGNHDTQSQRAGTYNGMEYEPGFALLSYIYNWPNHDWLGGNPNHTNDFLRGGGNWYFSYGDALYISLNSNIDINNAANLALHKNFMDKAYNSHPDATWKIVTFHHDIYGNGTGHSLGMDARRANWGPFLDSYDIDLVINGHDHTHARSFFMKDNEIQKYQMPAALDADELGIYNAPAGTYILPDGIQYITLGAAADVPKYTSHVPWQSHVAYSDPEAHDEYTQYSVMRIDGDTLKIETYIVEGTTERLHDGITLKKTADYADLQSLIPGLEEVPSTDIDPAGWAVFQSTLNIIKNVITANSPPESVHSAYIMLYDAFYALDSTTDKAALEALIAEVTSILAEATEGQWQNQHDVGSKAILQAILDKAVYLFDLRLAIQADVDDIFAELEEGLAVFMATAVGKPPSPWVLIHRIPSDAPYTMGLIDWMKEDEPLYTEPNLDGKPINNAYFTKAPYSHTWEESRRTENRFAPASAAGGRGDNQAHITKTRIGEWIRYELRIAQSGSYKATLGAVNPTDSIQTVVLRNENLDILSVFSIPANTPLPETGWKDAGLVAGDTEFYLPSGKVIVELYIVADGVGASSGADTPGNNYRDGPDIDILILERTGSMARPVAEINNNVWQLPFLNNRIGGDASHRQRAWSTDGTECPVSGMVGYGLPVSVYNRVVGLVMEVGGRPGGLSGNSTTQIHIMNDGGGQWLPEYNPTVGVIWNGDMGPFGSLVWDVVNMPVADGSSHPGIIHFPSFAATKEEGWINIAYYNSNWEELNYMRAYLLVTCEDCEKIPCICTSDWAADFIKEALEKNIVPEDLQNHYRRSITRGEFIRLAMSYLKSSLDMTTDELLEAYTSAPDVTFTDTDNEDILAAGKLGITAGVGGGVFGESMVFDREQAAIMLRRIHIILNGEPGEAPDASEFIDIGRAEWQPDSIDYVAAFGIMVGTNTEVGIFSPKGGFTREQAITTFVKLDN